MENWLSANLFHLLTLLGMLVGAFIALRVTSKGNAKDLTRLEELQTQFIICNSNSFRNTNLRQNFISNYNE